jgi:hypothetical protein
MDEALTNAREAILLHLEGLLDDGQSFPTPSTIEKLRSTRNYRGWNWVGGSHTANRLIFPSETST